MSWIRKSSLNCIQSCCVKVLKCGAVPKHVAFIMDGNRRYAKKNNVDKIQGHTKGFDKLSETLQWCLDLGIEEVTVYAFSIENFKRSQDEVESLMDLARQKFRRLLEEREKLMDHGVRIRCLGNRSYIPEDLNKLIAEAELMTRSNSRCFLNIALSYTARDEITHAVQTVVKGVEESHISEEDITPTLLSRCLYTNESPNPDMVIRTSGETRLSDFLLWQSSYSYLHFTDVLWPDFSAWHLLSAIFHYQRALANINQNSKHSSFPTQVLSQRAESFLETKNDQYWSSLKENIAVQ
ncbi:dehydrodolichyl diphosphate synthase complex subunit DHDDS [Nilaparvata lugens]|uniref:dehydrodolichyl diphosphate synthase complex subunit DHDDS n=1 Tax=Nilaparvata lugens TaxID=108931 RepID=UPI000B986C94|nr:dehydrodolichyl diphosphate synthase complex subunit DHDDS [Nilaparvata lugens]XP_022198504.1 dehydrodolichyl diphosphate synthase complex subunit DHDDS [Nilaparvata lugens]XP_039288561.1 dehydrodolichyl diphosphate synthase complex subunit DHDDS [Nilaparvata lugens]XP_039288562.1 dehydrodolichyl diphosphate synthase complex subunit DHDDS [Nilaparvata lugens]XP_039288563.1 dehydrodolichyl diphosphate synthase complex subunit DHDDS [Nilaparvata lugens]